MQQNIAAVEKSSSSSLEKQIPSFCSALKCCTNGFCFPFPCFEPCEEITEKVVGTFSFGNSGLEFPILMSSGPNVPTTITDGRSHRYLVWWLAQGPFPLLHAHDTVPVTLFSYTASYPQNWIPIVFALHKYGDFNHILPSTSYTPAIFHGNNPLLTFLFVQNHRLSPRSLCVKMYLQKLDKSL